MNVTGAHDLVRVTGGLVSGVDEAGGKVRSFKGIPFAAPPVGDLRWREPQPVRPWSGVRIADRFASVCQQPLVPRNAIMSLFSFDDPPECGMSEDCLYLNVWTGACAAEEKLPVIVWIFGGGHRVGGGSHPVSWGTSLAARGAVIVTLNYRVGALGFLAHPELTRESGASGNYGALDIIAALRWVRDNIAHFGGDPECVTIYGQSAGATEVSVMMASPLARGLFHRAIGSSGGRFDGALLGGPMANLAASENEGSAIVETLGARTLEDMRNLPADAFFGVHKQWGPIVDGCVLERSVESTFLSGDQAPVPLITGFNSDEGSPYPLTELHTRAGFAEFGKTTFGTSAATFMELYGVTNDATAHAQSYRVRRDGTFAYQAWRWASLHATTQDEPVFLYYFAHSVPLPRALRFREALPPGGFGAWHGAELWYAFDTLDTKPFPWQAADRRLAQTFSRAALAFARDGIPGSEWPRFSAALGEAAIIENGVDTGSVPNRAALEFYMKRATAFH
jgi:para-nitrobenzyl esterase